MTFAVFFCGSFSPESPRFAPDFTSSGFGILILTLIAFLSGAKYLLMCSSTLVSPGYLDLYKQLSWYFMTSPSQDRSLHYAGTLKTTSTILPDSFTALVPILNGPPSLWALETVWILTDPDLTFTRLCHGQAPWWAYHGSLALIGRSMQAMVTVKRQFFCMWRQQISRVGACARPDLVNAGSTETLIRLGPVTGLSSSQWVTHVQACCLRNLPAPGFHSIYLSETFFTM